MTGISIATFEACQISAEDFTHEAHMHVGWLYAQTYPRLEAHARFDAGLRRLTAHLGASSKYNAMITWLFMTLISDRARPSQSWADFRTHNADLFEGRPMARPLRPAGPVSTAFLRHTSTWAGALDHVRALPYGRVDHPDHVLALGRGTCSTKHAALALLAHEQGFIDVELWIGWFEMNEANTPGVGSALQAAALPAVPEAHVVLRVAGHTVDVTFPNGANSPPLHDAERLDPTQLHRKPDWHRTKLRQWCEQHGHDPDTVWNVREKAIAALQSQPAKGPM